MIAFQNLNIKIVLFKLFIFDSYEKQRYIEIFIDYF
jgi:hypothetical protein